MIQGVIAAKVGSALLSKGISKLFGKKKPIIELGVRHPGVDSASYARSRVYRAAADFEDRGHRRRFGFGWRSNQPADVIRNQIKQRDRQLRKFTPDQLYRFRPDLFPELKPAAAAPASPQFANALTVQQPTIASLNPQQLQLLIALLRRIT